MPSASPRSSRRTAISPQIEPVFEVVAQDDAEIDLCGIQALLFTSANGVRAFCSALSDKRPADLLLPVFAVGDASARTAAECGFSRIESADGDVTDLTDLVTARLDPAAGGLFHAAGSKVAGDLKGGLEAAGFHFGVPFSTKPGRSRLFHRRSKHRCAAAKSTR